MCLGKGEYDFFEMYMVCNIYKDKVCNYVLWQGKVNFSQGSLNYDVMCVLEMAGVVLEFVYLGLKEGDSYYDYSEMEVVLKGFLDGVLESKCFSEKWLGVFEVIIDQYMGVVFELFFYNGKIYILEFFKKVLLINLDDYVLLIFFVYYFFYEIFILEIFDNYFNGSYFNVLFDELQVVMDYVFSNGYIVVWDGDVSEKGFSVGDGLVILFENQNDDDKFKSFVDEVKVIQENWQQAFENFLIIDDYFMYLIGLVKDQNGQIYYIMKNSWGEISDYEGFLYMLVFYFCMKMVGMMVYKDVILMDIVSKLKL